MDYKYIHEKRIPTQQSSINKNRLSVNKGKTYIPPPQRLKYHITIMYIYSMYDTSILRQTQHLDKCAYMNENLLKIILVDLYVQKKCMNVALTLVK